MVRIAGINIPDNKNVLYGLKFIYGIGKSRAKYICDIININYFYKLGDLNSNQLNLIRDKISSFLIEGDLRREVMLNIKRLIDLNSYRGLRHRKHLPVRGQRTRTNAKTCRKLRSFK